jgi:hypothetical protein
MPEGTGTGDGTKPPTRESILAEFRDEFTALMKSGDVPARERKLNQRLFKLRLKNRDLEAQLAEAGAGKPKDGQVLLSKDDAAEFAAFKKLNLKAADLVTLVKEHGELRSTVAERDAEELYVEIADALGFENLPLFMRTMSREHLHVEFKDVQVRDEESGKMVTDRVPMVRAKDDDKAQLEPLDAYLQREMPEIIEAFQLEPAGEGEEGESPYAEGARGGESFERQIQRFGAGDPAARRAAGLPAKTGVTMPVTRNARPTSGAARTEKQAKERFEEKRAAYSL